MEMEMESLCVRQAKVHQTGVSKGYLTYLFS